MPKVRIIGIGETKVEKPSIDGLPLTKWIHDGKVVWENGGSEFKNLVAVPYGSGYLFYDFKQVKEIGRAINNIGSMGIIDDYVWFNFNQFFSDKGTQIVLGPNDEKIKLTEAGYVDTKARTTVVGAKDSLMKYETITDSSQVIGIKFYVDKINKDKRSVKRLYLSEVDAPNGISMPYLGSSIIRGIYTYPNIIFCKYHNDSEYDYGELCCIDDSGNFRILDTFASKRNGPYYGTSLSLNGYVFYANGKNYYFGNRSTWIEGGNQYYECYVLMVDKNGIITKNIIPNMFNTNIYDCISAVSYDKENDRYLMTLSIPSGYGYDVHVIEVDSMMNYIREFPLPDYIDVPMRDNKTEYYVCEGVRVALKSANIPSRSGYRLCRNVYAGNILGSTYFNEDGEIIDNKGYEIRSESFYDLGLYVHIDNLYFNESSGNMAYVK